MLTVHLVDHLRDVIDGIEHLRIRELQVHLVADDPAQQRRVILVLHYFAADVLELGRDGFFVIVIEAVAFPLYIDTHKDRYAVFEGLLHLVVGVKGAPVSGGIAAVGG